MNNQEQKIIKWGEFAGTLSVITKKMRALKKYIKDGVYFEAEEMDFKTLDLLAKQRKLKMAVAIDKTQPFFLLSVFGPVIHQDARQKVLEDDSDDEEIQELFAIVGRNEHGHVSISDFAPKEQTYTTFRGLVATRDNHSNNSRHALVLRQQELSIVKLIEVAPEYSQPRNKILREQLQREIDLCSTDSSRSKDALINLAKQIHELENP
jgi:hypothetical protein